MSTTDDVTSGTTTMPDFEIDPGTLRHLGDAAVGVELDTRDMILNLGPQHPETHGTLRLVVRLDGEHVVAADPVIGYMHRGYEKLTEFRTYPQITTLINRIDWLTRFANEVPFIHTAELLMEIEAPPPRSRSARSSPSCRASRRSTCSSARWASSRRAHAGVLGLPRPRARPQPHRGGDRRPLPPELQPHRRDQGRPALGLDRRLPRRHEEHPRRLRRLRGRPGRQRDLRARGIGIVPSGARRGVRPLRREPAPRASTGTCAATASRASCTGSSTSRSGPTATATRPRATGCSLQETRASPRAMVLQTPATASRRPDHGEGAAHHQGARGRGLGRDREPARPDGYYVVSRARPARSG